MGCASSSEAVARETSTSRAPKGAPTWSQLRQAARQGTLANLIPHVDRAILEQKDETGQTLMHAAVCAFQPESVRALLQTGSRQATERDQEYRLPVHTLVVELARQPGKRNQAVQILNLLLGNHSVQQLDVPDQDCTPLQLAVLWRQEELARAMLDARFNPATATRSEQVNTLQLALRQPGLPQLVSHIVRIASDMRLRAELVNHVGRDGNTALHLVISNQHPAALQPLLNVQELDPNIADAQGNTPLHLVLSALVTSPNNQQLMAAARTLLSRQCRIDMPNAANQTAITLAVDLASLALQDTKYANMGEILKAMAFGEGMVPRNSKGAFDALGRAGVAAVHIAAAAGSAEVLQECVRRGANPDLPDRSGNTAAFLALQAGHLKVLQDMYQNLPTNPLALSKSGVAPVAQLLLQPGKATPADLLSLTSAVIQSMAAQNALDKLAKQPVAVNGTPTVVEPLPLLHLACALGQAEVAHMLLSKGKLPVDTPTPQSALTPLAVTVAAASNARNRSQAGLGQFVQVANVLIKAGASPLAKVDGGGSVLGMCIEQGLLDMAVALIRTNSSALVNQVSSSGASTLYLAITQGKQEYVQELISQLKAGSGPQEHFVPLHVAVGMRDVKAMEVLLSTPEGQASAAVKDAQQLTPMDYLWHAWNPRHLLPDPVGLAVGPAAAPSEAELLPMVQMLMRAKGVDVNSLDPKSGLRPLHWAVKLGSMPLLQALASHPNLDPNLPDAEGVTPLVRAVQNGDNTFVQAMLASLPNVNLGSVSNTRGVSGTAGQTPLHAAIAAGNAPLATSLIRHQNVDLDMESFHLCMRLLEDQPGACQVIMEELLNAKHAARCQISLKGSKAAGSALLRPVEAYPLHMVAMHNQADIVNLLVLRAGANVNQPDNSDLTPLHIAVSARAYDAATELVALGADVCALVGSETSPLILACKGLDPRMVNILLASKNLAQDDINAVDRTGNTAFTTVFQTLLEASQQQQARISSMNGTEPDARGLNDQNSALNSYNSIKASPPPRQLQPATSSSSFKGFAKPSVLIFEPSQGAQIGVPETPVGFPNSVLAPSVSMQLARQLSVSAAGLPDHAVAIFFSLVQCGANVNQPFTARRQLSTMSSSVSQGSFSVGDNSMSRTPLQSMPSVAGSSAGDMGDEAVTPLLLAIFMRAVKLVEMLLLVPEQNLDLSGNTNSVPAMHMALQCLQTVAPSDDKPLATVPQPRPSLATMSKGQGKPDKGQSMVNRLFTNARNLLSKKDLQPPPATTDEALQAAWSIVRQIALDDRTPLVLKGSSGQAAGSYLMQLASLAQREALQAEVLSLLHDLVDSGRDLDINAVEPASGQTVLHQAAARGDVALLNELGAAKDINFNLPDNTGRCPLACAVDSGSADAVLTLLRHGRDNQKARAPMDLNCIASDRSKSAMALALARADTVVLQALAGSAQDFKAPSVLEVPMDREGTTPLLWAIYNEKYDHALVLVKCGADLGQTLDSVPDPMLLEGLKKGSMYAQAGGQGSMLTPQKQWAAPSGVTSQKVIKGGKDSPFTLLCKQVWQSGKLQQLKGKQPKDKDVYFNSVNRLAVAMTQDDSLDAVMKVQDCYGLTPLHWGVVLRHPPLVAMLALRANRLRSVDLADSIGWTALHFAADLSDYELTQILLKEGGASRDATTDDHCTPALLAANNAAVQDLLANPPKPEVLHPGDDIVMPRRLVKDSNASSQNWGQFSSLRALGDKLTPESLSKKASEENKLETENQAEAKRVVSGLGFQTFQQLCRAGANASQSLPVAGALVGAVCTLADGILKNIDTVEYNNRLVEHLCARIRNNLPVLKSLRTACEARADDPRGPEMAKQLFPQVQRIGETFIQTHKVVDEWCHAGKASLLVRMLSAEDFYQHFKDLDQMLTSCMTDLGTTLSTWQLLEVPRGALESSADREAKVKETIRADLQAATRDLVELEAMEQGEKAEEAKKLFKQYGLNYDQLRKAERKRWIRDKIQDLLIPNIQIELLADSDRPVRSDAAFEVYKASWQGFMVAFKKFNKGPVMQGDKVKESCENEAFIMSQLRHPNILHLYGVVQKLKDKDSRNPTNAYGLIVDYHPGGSLQDIIDRDDGAQPLSLVQRVELALQIARGMAYLHGRGVEPIVHGDLKPSNVLIAADGRAVIKDFGCARILNTGNTTMTNTMLPPMQLAESFKGADSFKGQSTVYTAPEVLERMLKCEGDRRRKPPQDVYAFGILMLEIMTLQSAHRNFASTTGEYSERIVKGDRPPLPDELPLVLRICIQQCWQQEPDKRPHFSNIVHMLAEIFKSMSKEAALLGQPLSGRFEH